MPLKIAVNVRYLRAGQLDGIGWFSYYTISELVRRHPQITFYLFFAFDGYEEFDFGPNVKSIRLYPPTKHALLNVAWFEISVRLQLERLKPDLFISPDGILCYGWRGPQHATIHDLGFLHYPKDVKWSNREYFSAVFARTARRAARIATVSEFTKQDVVARYGVAPEKIDVVYNGFHPHLAPAGAADAAAARACFAGGRPYFLFVGSLSPRKNIVRLMQAFEVFKKETGSEAVLILAGWEYYKTGELRALQASLAHGADILFTGRVPDADLGALLGGAFAFAFVSYFEGFGIPPLEAMSCGVPVLAADATAIPEIVGDAALLADPFDIQSIASGMARLWREPALRETLVKRGFARKEMFPWSRTAGLFCHSVERCLPTLSQGNSLLPVG